MTGRLQLIEQKLAALDSATFQNLCDTYLALREQEFRSFSRTGSQLGKKKTIKGTPDTFYRLADGRLIFVEYTTKEDRLVTKIKEDIDKCLDKKKTGVSLEKIYKIIICFNSRLSSKEEAELLEYAQSKSIRVELIGIDLLAIDICSKHLLLAKEFLGIALDTGQLLPLDSFVDQYNNKAGGLSTPLDNEFLHRHTELTAIATALSEKDLLILSGAPGVGKTKIGLESINNFIETYAEYQAYVVVAKDRDIFDDLQILLQQDKEYILLIDDANRQMPNLKQIIDVFREVRKGNIKLVLTVRNYALHDILNLCRELSYEHIDIKKFTDEEIIALIASESVKILHHKYQKKIVELADGNARLALMAARLAHEKQFSFLHGDVSHLYDSYFHSFIKDFDIFSDNLLLKTLGIVSFFFTIDRNNKVFIEKLLANFDIDHYQFNEAIDDLHIKELVEVQSNYVRVAEQTTATYFFYKVFIKDELLSFHTLLFNYFPDWKRRFSDSIIPANNTFSFDSMIDKINPVLDEYLAAINGNDKVIMDFFSLFWFYKLEEVLMYFHDKIKQLAEPENTAYYTDYKLNDYVFDRDETLDYLSNFFYYYSDNFKFALELSFEYCRNKPDALPELIRRIRETLSFGDSDEINGFIRQEKLFDLLIKRSDEGLPHYSVSFFALAQTFLGHYFEVRESGRKLKIVFYQYSLPVNETIIKLRKRIWEALFSYYSQYPSQVLDVMYPRPEVALL